jgi:hypothetical protein
MYGMYKISLSVGVETVLGTRATPRRLAIRTSVLTAVLCWRTSRERR